MPGKLPVYKARMKRDADGAIRASYKKNRAADESKQAEKKTEQKAGARTQKKPADREERKSPFFLWEAETKSAPAAARGRKAPAEGSARAKQTAKKEAAGGNTAKKETAKKQTAGKTPAKNTGNKKVSAGKSVYKVEDGSAARRSAGKQKPAAASGRRNVNGRQAKSAQASRSGRIVSAGEADRTAQRQQRLRMRSEKKEAAKYRDRKLAVSRSPGFAVTLIALLTAAFEALGLLLVASASSGVMDMQALYLLCGIVPLGLLTTLVLPRFLPVDPLIMALTNFLCGLSVVILYTVSPDRGVRQAMFYGVGIALMLVVSVAVARMRRWKGLTVLSMLLGIGALILPLAFGEWQGGAKNWVSVPVLGSFQPSEFVKLSIVLTLAYYFSAHRTVLQMMPAILFAGACLVLLMLQRDLGTALIYYMTTVVLFYAACGNVPLTILGLGGGAGAAVLGYRMFAHVKVRVAMWRNPWSDPLDKGYQIIQALLAIGSGGLFGVGLGQGTPNMIPAYYNDFIFAVICEQMGLVFGLLVLGVYLLLIMRGVTVISRTRRSFDMLLGCGVLAMLAIQTFMIVGGVIKMLPLTGVTMPFLSYGGSSLLSCLAMAGILHGVSARVQENLEEDVLGA